jgi:adenylate cyclase
VKKHVLRIALGLLIVVGFLLHAAGYLEVPVINRLEALAYDARLQLTMPRTVDPRIVIVDIDERSLAAEGRWPWRRNRVGLMLDRLFDEYKVRAVGFDVVFAERDESSGLAVLRELSGNELRAVPAFQSALDQVAPRLEYDRIFAEKIKGRPVVLGYYFNRDPEEVAAKVNQLPAPVQLRGEPAGVAAGGRSGRPFQSLARPGRRDAPRTHAGRAGRRVL